MNAEDAEKYGIKDGDEVIVQSRRGLIQVSATISKIVKGQIFVPFHFGYWDIATGSAASAANELTFGMSYSSTLGDYVIDHITSRTMGPNLQTTHVQILRCLDH